MQPSRPAPPWCVRVGRIQQTFGPLFQGGVPVAVPDSLPSRKAKALADRRWHSGVVPSSLVGGQGILTITLALADQSRRAGWDEGSSPLSMASSRSYCGSAATSLTSTGLALLAPRSADPILRSPCGVGLAGESHSRLSPDPVMVTSAASSSLTLRGRRPSLVPSWAGRPPGEVTGLGFQAEHPG